MAIVSLRRATQAAAVYAGVTFNCGPILAQDASTTSPPTSLPSVVVESTSGPVAKTRSKTSKKNQRSKSGASNASTAHGQTPVISPTTISTPVDQVPSSISVITSDQLQQEQRRTVPDALQRVPGINVVQTGGPGGQTSVFMRGTNSNHVKVLVDGIDVSDPSTTNGSFDFAHLLTGDVARIETLRGPQSGLYGSDAIGGVISIVTKGGDGPPQVYGQIEGGSFGTFNQATGVSGSEHGFNYAFNIQHFRADDVPVTPDYLVPDGQSRLNNSYDNMTYSTKLGAKISEDLGVNFVARYIDSTYRYNGLYHCAAGFDPITYACRGPNMQEPGQTTQDSDQFMTRGEVVWSLLNGRFKNYFGAAYSDTSRDISDPYGDYGPSSYAYDGDRTKYDWRGVFAIAPDQFLLAGVERQDESMDTHPGTYRTGDTGAYVELQSQWAKRVFLDSNIRYDDDDSFGGHTTWRVAPAVLVPFTETKLKGSIGTGFKAPSLNDLYVSYPSFGFYANPDLKPEESTGYDVGFEQPLFHDRIRFGSTYFNNDLTNLIECDYTTCYNIGEANTHGFESFIAYAVTPTLHLRADHTYTIATDETTGEELQRRPRNKFSLTTTWNATSDLTLSATVIALSSWKENYIASNPAPGYTSPGFATVNLAANYALTDNLTLFGRIDNLLDRKYEDPAGYLQPGFGIFAGLKVSGNLNDLVAPAK
jgi:vitamin B12 transporter